MEAVVLLVTDIKLSITENVGSAVEKSYMVAEEVTFRKIITIAVFVCVYMCAWYHFHKCSIEPGVQNCAEQNIEVAFDTLQRT